MSENKNAKTPADGDPLPVATSAMTLEEAQQWITTTWLRCQDEVWRQPTTKTVVYLTAGSYSLETLENLVELLRKVADD
jgi:hypothetical protein